MNKKDNQLAQCELEEACNALLNDLLPFLKSRKGERAAITKLKLDLHIRGYISNYLQKQNLEWITLPEIYLGIRGNDKNKKYILTYPFKALEVAMNNEFPDKWIDTGSYLYRYQVKPGNEGRGGKGHNSFYRILVFKRKADHVAEKIDAQPSIVFRLESYIMNPFKRIRLAWNYLEVMAQLRMWRPLWPYRKALIKTELVLLTIVLIATLWPAFVAPMVYTHVDPAGLFNYVALVIMEVAAIAYFAYLQEKIEDEPPGKNEFPA